MKKWLVKHTSDKETFNTTEIEGTSYTDAYVNFTIKHPGEIIFELTEKEA